MALAEQAELVLRLAPTERLEFLLEAPRPMALVRALPDADLHLTVREVGPHDALPLLALASASQIAHLLDLEGWRRDRFDALRTGAWVALFAESGEATLKRFVRHADDELLTLLLRDWARVRSIAIDHEEPTRGHGLTEAGDELGAMSPDGAYRFSPERTEHQMAVRRFAEALFLDDQPRYLGLVRAALWELPSALEEQALHWRNSRLEEHGYPPFEDALAVYAPPDEHAVATPAPPRPAGAEGLSAPRAALAALGRHGLVPGAAEALDAATRERVLFGLTAVASRVLVADGADTGSIEAQRRALERASAYVGLALEARGASDPSSAAALLSEIPAVELFRQGFARPAALAARARAMLGRGWGAGHPRALDLLDAPLRARVAALLEPRPLYVDADAERSVRLRDFRALAEVDETRAGLDLLDALARTLLVETGTTAPELLDEERRAFEETPRFSTLLLTMLAWHAVRDERRIDRLPQDLVADFLRTTASRRTADPDAAARAMDKLLEAIAADYPLRSFAGSCLERLAADCAGVEPGTPVTPRIVGCLRLG